MYRVVNSIVIILTLSSSELKIDFSLIAFKHLGHLCMCCLKTPKQNGASNNPYQPRHMIRMITTRQDTKVLRSSMIEVPRFSQNWHKIFFDLSHINNMKCTYCPRCSRMSYFSTCFNSYIIISASCSILSQFYLAIYQDAFSLTISFAYSLLTFFFLLWTPLPLSSESSSRAASYLSLSGGFPLFGPNACSTPTLLFFFLCFFYVFNCSYYSRTFISEGSSSSCLSSYFNYSFQEPETPIPLPSSSSSELPNQSSSSLPILLFFKNCSMPYSS